MVREWGMSERVGLRSMESSRGQPSQPALGPQTNELVDTEIKKLLSESYERAKAILRTHAKEHKALAEALLKYETLDAEDIKAIMNGDKLGSDKSRGGREREPSPAASPSPSPSPAPPHLLPPQPQPA